MVDSELRFTRETLAVAIVLFLGSLFIVFPFLDALILAVVTSYLLRFAHEYLEKRIENELLSNIIISTFVLGVVSTVLYLFINNFFDILTGVNSIIGSMRELTINFVEFVNLPERFQQNIENVIDNISNLTRNRLIEMFASVPSILIHTGIYTVTSIYLYKDGAKIESKVFEIIDSLPEEEEKIARSLTSSIDYVFRGVFITQILVSLILAATAGLGFYIIAHLTSPIPLIPLIAFLIFLASLLPLVANFMIYGPVGGYFLLQGQPLKGSLILFFGLVILQIMPEIFLRPYIGSRQMDEHPLIIFIGFLAGPLTLGVKGVILGPLILILTKEFIRDYTRLVSE